MGENVLNLLRGSGSTLPTLPPQPLRVRRPDIACEQTGRRAFLMEVDALYCDVIVQRWEQFTGQKAERVSPAEEAAHAEG